MWDQGLVAALHHTDQDLGAKALRALPQAKAVEGAALRDAAVDDLGAALGKGFDPDSAGEAQDARDFLGALVFGVDYPGDAESLPQKFHLRQILRVAHPGDDVLGAETARGQRADHVGLVALGHGHEDIGPGRAAFAQRVGIGGAAEHADHVLLVGYGFDGLAVPVDQRDIVALGLQALGDARTHHARAGYDDFQGSSPRLLSRAFRTINY